MKIKSWNICKKEKRVSGSRLPLLERQRVTEQRARPCG